jgi:type IV pilus assembly protein PilB
MPFKLGELLLKENMVSPQQLQLALNQQKTKGGTLQAAFVGLGFVRDEEIVQLLSRQLRVPSVDLRTFEVDAAVIRMIPAETARKYQVLPLSRDVKILKLAMADPTNVFAMDDIKFMTGCNVQPLVASESVIEEAIQRYYPGTRSWEARRDTSLKETMENGPGLSVDDMASIGGLSELDLDAMGVADALTVKAEDEEIDLASMGTSAHLAPIVKLTNVLLVDSLKRGASDIHVEPYEKEFRVRFRIDGVLYNVMALPLGLRDSLISRIKFMAKIKSGEKRFLQEGRITIRLKVEDRSHELAFRVRCVPTLWGESIVMRVLDKSRLMIDRTELGLEPQSLKRFEDAIAKPYGLVLLTGPRRSGKTNALYSAIASLNRTDCNIFTVEDPVEFTLPGINQVQVNEDTGATFAAVLRSFRQLDPDIIAASEIRDADTADLMLKLALNGRLVISTLDTNDAPSTVSRLANMGVDLWPMAVAVTLIQAQRLVRRNCEKCKADITGEVPSTSLVDVGFKPEEIGGFQLLKGKGCNACHGTGFKGWVGLFETMEISEQLRELIKVGATAVEIRKQALEEGMLTLRRSGLEKIKQGITTIDEVLRETVL